MRYDSNILQEEIKGLSSNKLFCTFTHLENLNDTIRLINRTYTILFDKIFVLSISETKELICTYNIDTSNTLPSHIIPDTIIIQRKKDTNTLYTVKALNALIESINNGVLDPYFRINWNNYKNSILITRDGELCHLATKIYDVIHIRK